jgi:hypothetical protein
MRLKAFVMLDSSSNLYPEMVEQIKSKATNLVLRFNRLGDIVKIVNPKEDTYELGMAWYQGDCIDVVCEVLHFSEQFIVKLLERGEDGGFNIPSQSVINEWSCKSDYFKIPEHLRDTLSDTNGVGYGYAVINKNSQQVVRIGITNSEIPTCNFEGDVIANNYKEIALACVFANAGANTTYLFRGNSYVR